MQTSFSSRPLCGLIVALALASAIGPAHADSECQAAIFLDGLAGRGEILCDPAWLDRKGAYAIVAEERAGNKTPGAHAQLRKGMDRFDGDTRRLGKAAACAKIDHLIRFVEKQRGLQ